MISPLEFDRTDALETLTNLVMTINFGLRVQSRQNQSRQDIKTVVENSLSILGLAA